MKIKALKLTYNLCLLIVIFLIGKMAYLYEQVHGLFDVALIFAIIFIGVIAYRKHEKLKLKKDAKVLRK